MIAIAFLSSITDMFRPMFWGYVIRAVCMTIGALILTAIITVVFILIIGSLISTNDVTQTGYFETAFVWLGMTGIMPYLYGSLWGVLGGSFLMGSFFIFPIFLTTVVGLYSDDIAISLEKSNGYNQGMPTPTHKAVLSTVRLMMILIIVNILALPVYFMAGFLSPFIYMVINGYFFGREYFEMVGLRHFSKVEMKSFRQENIFSIICIGIFFIMVVNIPFLNLILPAFMVAFVVHCIGNKNPLQKQNVPRVRTH